MSEPSKSKLASDGVDLMKRFCEANFMLEPMIKLAGKEDHWGLTACAYYRKDLIHVHIPSCAHIGTGGASWSYPGYFIDRTPFGVIQHELGHHVDFTLGDAKEKYSSEFSVKMRRDSGEEKLTNYCPNDAEWFAEMFRLFATNPDLLKLIRPKTYELIRAHLEPVVNQPWRDVLACAPVRNIEQCLKRSVSSRTIPEALLC